jgi:tRNA-intron endonuclease, archaea type
MNKIQAYLMGETISSNSSEAYYLNSKSSFGEKKEDKIIYSPSEALFLVEKGKMEVFYKNKKIESRDLDGIFRRTDRNIQMKYPVFKELRERGYIVKTALKFGADFRVYEKGKLPGEEHAKWLVFVEYSSRKINWNEFSAKNRVAHSTKKKLLLAIVDDEKDVTYYEVSWVKV